MFKKVRTISVSLSNNKHKITGVKKKLKCEYSNYATEQSFI